MTPSTALIIAGIWVAVAFAFMLTLDWLTKRSNRAFDAEVAAIDAENQRRRAAARAAGEITPAPLPSIRRWQ